MTLRFCLHFIHYTASLQKEINGKEPTDREVSGGTGSHDGHTLCHTERRPYIKAINHKQLLIVIILFTTHQPKLYILFLSCNNN